MLPHEMLQTQTQVERSLLSRVMGWLALSLALTTGGIYLWIAGVVPQNIPWLLYFIVAIGLIFGIQAATNSKNQSLAVGLFGLFSVIEGLFIAPIVAYYLHAAPDAVGSALLGTVGIFLVAAAVVYLTSINMAAWGRYLLGALLVGIVISFATRSSTSRLGNLPLAFFFGAASSVRRFSTSCRVRAERAGDNNRLLLALAP